MTDSCQVDWWVSKENALQEFFPEFKIDDAVAIREVRKRTFFLLSCITVILTLIRLFRAHADLWNGFRKERTRTDDSADCVGYGWIRL
jgi:hypothetical protein